MKILPHLGHDVGATPGFKGDAEAALRSIRIPVLYMRSATDMYSHR